MAGQLGSRYNYGLLFDSIESLTAATTFTKAQKRWRVAYMAIYFTLHLSKDFVAEKKIHFTKAQKRWRLAYVAIYSSRAMLSLVRDIVTDEISRRRSSGSSHSPAYNILDIQPASSYYDVHENIKGTCSIKIDDIEDYSCFRNIDQSKLAKMVEERDLSDLHSFGGLEGLAKALQTDPEDGISNGINNVSLRRYTFGSNTYHKPPPKGFVFFMLEAFKDTTILILLGCAVLSLGFGIKEQGAAEGWYEGGSIIVAVFLVVAVSAVSNFRQEGQFDKLSKISNNIKIDVVRDGKRQQTSIFDVVVGDVVFLTIGDQVPADGLFMKGHSLQIDESSMTGESDHVEVDRVQHPFLLSGSKVVDGYAHMLVTSVGMNTAWGRMMSSIAHDSNEQTPLQARLEKLTSSIGKVGLAVASLVLVVLLIRYFTGNTKDESGKQEFNGRTKISDVFNSVVRLVADAVTIVVVAIPEGLPLAVTLTLAYSMKRMMKDQAMVRKLSACETMGSATVIHQTFCDMPTSSPSSFTKGLFPCCISSEILTNTPQFSGKSSSLLF